MKMPIKVIEIPLPEYNIKKKPDYIKLGMKVDKEIAKHFPDGNYIVRAIGSDDHPNFSVDELVKIILKLGTDRYDPKREAVCHEEFSMYDYEIHASTMEIKNSKIIPSETDKYKSIFADVVYHFFEHTPLDRGYPVRIDILLIYDSSKLVRAEKIDSDAERARIETEECLYKFKNPKKKKEALVGVVKILKK